MKADGHRMLNLALVLGLLGMLAGCGGGDDSGPSGPSIPNILGAYSGSWDITLENQDKGETVFLDCPGNITIETQSNGTFSGSYLIDSTGD